MYEIEKGIPISGSSIAGSKKYPFDDMKKGDSFFVPCKPEDRKKLSSTLLTCCKRTGNVFTLRYLEEEGGIRCWRIT